jgi:hypothetical protein
MSAHLLVAYLSIGATCALMLIAILGPRLDRGGEWLKLLALAAVTVLLWFLTLTAGGVWLWREIRRDDTDTIERAGRPL